MTLRFEDFVLNHTKKMVNVELDVSHYIKTDSIDSMITSLQALKGQYGSEYTFGVYGDYDGSVIFGLYTNRLETDEEFDIRIRKLYDERVRWGKEEHERNLAKQVKNEARRQRIEALKKDKQNQQLIEGEKPVRNRDYLW